LNANILFINVFRRTLFDFEHDLLSFNDYNSIINDYNQWVFFFNFEVICGLKEIVLKITNPKKRFTITEHLNNFIMDATMIFSEPASEVYSKAIKINEELSPQNRKKNRSQNIRVVIKN